MLSIIQEGKEFSRMTSDNPEGSTGSPLKNNLLGLLKRLFLKNKTKQFDSKAYENLDTPRQEMIRGVFALSDQNAKDIMIPRVDIIALDSKVNLKSLVKTACEAGHSRIPVFKETIDNIIGVLYVKDLLKLLIDKSKKFQLKKVLHDPFFVPETMPLDELLLEFKLRKLHLAVLLDEYGGVAGIVTMEDVLEEIVGEIRDEFDDDEIPEIEKTGKNTFEVDSRMPISDFNESTGLQIPTDEFDTIGGFVFDVFGKIPDKNETIKHRNLTIKIIDISGTVINRIKITVSPE